MGIMECSKTLSLPINCGCNNNLQLIKSILIKDDKYYVNGEYWGEIIEKTDNYIKVKCNNGNKYMNGQIRKIYINLNAV